MYLNNNNGSPLIENYILGIVLVPLTAWTPSVCEAFLTGRYYKPHFIGKDLKLWKSMYPTHVHTVRCGLEIQIRRVQSLPPFSTFCNDSKNPGTSLHPLFAWLASVRGPYMSTIAGTILKVHNGFFLSILQQKTQCISSLAQECNFHTVMGNQQAVHIT